MKNGERISKEEALNFLLVHIIVDRGQTLNLDQIGLFQLTNIAQRAADSINKSEAVIPHEVIETLADEHLKLK
tara:strand:+ start:659 stop:877 length:219 start_codon:yes stop_codon:yes gene_type:complete